MLANVRLGVSQDTHELILYVATDGPGPLQKRLMTWETMRAVVEYMQLNRMNSIEVWFKEGKHDLTLSEITHRIPYVSTITLADQIKALAHEVSMRRAMYPGMVASGRMTAAEADHGIDVMNSALETLARSIEEAAAKAVPSMQNEHKKR